MDFVTRLEREGIRWLTLDGQTSAAGQMWRYFAKDDVTLWLNGEGEGAIWGGSDRLFLRRGMYAIFGGNLGEKWSWTRLAGAHSVHVIHISRGWLAKRLGSEEGLLHPDFSSWLEQGGAMSFTGLLSVEEQRVAEFLVGLEPTTPGAGLRLEARVLEWASLRLFRRSRQDEGGGFCHRYSHGDLVERVTDILRTRLDEPLMLDDLARDLSMSPAYLSRMVKRLSGKTLRETFRALRVARACELLRSGEARVTDVALDVGYQSLSHFAKAFRTEMGVSPKRWMMENR